MTNQDDAQRRADRWNKRYAGKSASKLGKDGYNWISPVLVIDGKRCPLRCDRAAWLIMTGAEPIGEIIHINGDNADDRFDNLRDSGAPSH